MEKDPLDSLRIHAARAREDAYLEQRLRLHDEQHAEQPQEQPPAQTDNEIDYITAAMNNLWSVVKGFGKGRSPNGQWQQPKGGKPSVQKGAPKGEAKGGAKGVKVRV